MLVIYDLRKSIFRKQTQMHFPVMEEFTSPYQCFQNTYICLFICSFAFGKQRSIPVLRAHNVDFCLTE